MSILVNKETRILIQGITGAEGSRCCKYMKEYGAQVVAGVTPGKGGQIVEGVSVYDTVKEATAAHPGIDATYVTVPTAFVKDAVLEAVSNRVPLIVILTEYVAPADSSYFVAMARKYGSRVVGPSSVGIISPAKSKIGVIGSGEVQRVFTPGPIGVISKSGGMCAEIAQTLTRNDYGQSTVVGIGGDMIVGSDYVDMLKLFADDPETKAIVMMGEVGGTYEEDAAEYIASTKYPKPVIALIGGKFAAQLKTGVVLGHAGAIVSGGKGSFDSKVAALKSAGVHIAASVEEIPLILKRIL